MLLEALTPQERAVFLLREVFEYEFAEIATMLGKSEAASRRSFSRAKQHLRAQRPRFPVVPQVHRQLLSSYFQAVQQGEMAPLMSMLAENVTLWTDGGGKARTAALRPVHGRDAVARMSLGSRRFWPEGYCAEVAEVNGQPAMVIRAEEQAYAVVTIEVEDEQIQAIHVIVNPEKLERI
jgi:RNA polymerase sigma-70 factor, ECF subfamily